MNKYKIVVYAISKNESLFVDRWVKSMSEADVSRLDGKCVMAMIVGAVRAERFCDGALLGFFKDGSIRKWLERLRELNGMCSSDKEETEEQK